MKTARAKIDVFNGILTMEFDGEVVSFNIFDAMRYPNDVYAYLSIDPMDTLVQRFFELEKEDTLVVALKESLECMMVENEVHHYAT